MNHDQPRDQLPPSEVDELASAYVDGELSEAEVAGVESDGRLLDRVVELRAVRLSDLGFPTVDDDGRRTHLAAAMGEYDRLYPAGVASATPTRDEALPSTGSSPSVPPGGAVTEAPIDLRAARQHRDLQQRGWRRLAGPRLVQLAAGVLLVAGIGFGMSRFGSDADDSADGDAAMDLATESADADRSAAGNDAADDAIALNAAESDAAESDAADMTMAAPADDGGAEAGGIDEESADHALAGGVGEPLVVAEPGPPGETASVRVQRILDQLVAEGIDGRLSFDGAVCGPVVAGAQYQGYVAVIDAAAPQLEGGELHVYLGPDGRLVAVLTDSACTELGRTDG